MTSYTLLAYALTWLGWIPALVIAGRKGYLLPYAANYAQLAREGFSNAEHAVLSLAFALAVYGPIIAAVAVTIVDRGPAGVRELMRRGVIWRVGSRWYGAVALIGLALLLVPLAAGAITGLLPLGEIRFAPLPFLLLMFAVQMLTSGLGEEPGWRGLLYPRLAARHGTQRAIWWSGLIWAGWHYPLTIYDTATKVTGVPPVGVIVVVLVALAGNTMSLIGMTYLYAWLINRTGSVLLAMVLHSLSNLVALALVGGFAPTLGLVMAVTPWVMVFLLQRVYGTARFPGNPGHGEALG